MRELAPAFRAGSLLRPPGAPASMLTQSGSKLPHSTNDSHGACPVFLWFEDFDATLTHKNRRGC